MSAKPPVEVFEKSYTEVLAALKHQDEKLSQTLTALAFLSTAGLALFAGLLSQRRFINPEFAHEWNIGVTTFFFALFIVTILAAVSLVLAAIGPGDPLTPWHTGAHDASLIFYAAIAEDKKWNDYLVLTSPELTAMLTRNYHREARIIAWRVVYKITRSREAAAFVHISVLALGLFGVFSVEQFSVEARWRIVVFVLLMALILPIWDVFLIWRVELNRQARPNYLSADAYIVAGLACVIGAVLLFSATAVHARWWAIWNALASILLLRLSVAYRSVPRAGKLMPVAALVIGLLVVIVAFVTS